MIATALQVLILISTVFFQDDFNDGTANDWYTVGPSTYEVENSRYHFSGGGAVNDATSFRGDLGETMSSGDYSIRADVEIDVGVFGGLMARYSEDGLYNLMLVMSIPHQSVNLYRWYWSSIVLIDSYSFPVEAGITYSIRMQCSGNTFAGRAWLPGEDEPTNWFVTTTDTLTRPGAAALFTAGVSKTPTDVYLSCFFDNVVVESPEPWSLTQSTWAQIKRLDL